MRSVSAVTFDDPPRVVGIVDDAGSVLADISGLSMEEVLEWLTGGAPSSSVLSWGFSPFVECLSSRMPLAERILFCASLETTIAHGLWRLLYIPGKFLEIRRLRKIWRLYDVSGMFPSGRTLAETLARWSITSTGTHGMTSGAGSQLSLPLLGRLTHKVWRDLGLESALLAARGLATAITALMLKVESALERISLKPARWHGIGSVASKILNDAKARSQIAIYTPDRQPEVNGAQLLPIFLAASYGGRVETTVAGSRGPATYPFPTYRYDLRGAYAWALSHLGAVGFEWIPCDQFHDSSEDRMSVWYVRWDMAAGSPLGPLPYRNRLGGISYPLSGSGWYWWPEVRAALDAYGESSVRVVSGYVSPRSRRRPLSEQIARRWQQRRELDEAGDPAADLLKTGMASVYGRLAQRESSGGQPGRFYNPALAGWVTSAVRSRLIGAYAHHENAVVSIATDAIVSTEPLGVTPAGDLGGWKQDQWSSVSYVLPGVYRLRNEQREEVATAGLHGVDFDDLLAQLTDHGRASYSQKWFVPNILSDQYPDSWESRRCQWIDTPVSVNPYRISRKRQGGDGLIGMDWRTDFHHLESPHARGGLGDSWPADGPPAWAGLTDPTALALARVSKTR